MLLTLGVLLWAALHLSIAATPGLRQSLIQNLGMGPYKGLFSLGILASLVLIVVGWKAFPASSLYLPPAGMRHATMSLMPLAIILLIASVMPSDIKRLVRHPQLTGLKLWAVAHLLSNGETRSLILFGGLLAWAVLEVILIKKRDGVAEKPAKAGILMTAINVLAGLAITAALMLTHQHFTGMPLFAAR